MDNGDNKKQVKRPWTEEEDALLLSRIRTHGARNWIAVSAGIPDRSSKSCRMRWLNQLNPEIKHTPFTLQEETLIYEKYADYPNRWATIASYLPGRTDNAIKNHWHVKLSHHRENYVNVLPPGTRNDSAGSSSVPSPVGSWAPELGHHHGNPINVIPPCIRIDSAGSSSSGSVPLPPLVVDADDWPRAPERGSGVDTTLRLSLPGEISTAAQEPEEEDGVGEEAEVDAAPGSWIVDLRKFTVPRKPGN